MYIYADKSDKTNGNITFTSVIFFMVLNLF